MVSAADLKSIHDTVKPHYICLVEVSAFGGGGGLSICGGNGDSITKIIFYVK